jgi:molecular chaperone GrpE
MKQAKSKDKNKEKGKEIEKQLIECRKLNEEYLNGWKRARADFLNYKEGEARRIGEFVKHENEKFILKLLPVLDNLYIAEKELPKELKNNQWVEGILKTKNQILDFLKGRGVEEIQSLGKKFDPNFHEAVGEVEKKGVEAETVVEEVKKGYLFHGKVIRPAKVRVAK